MFEDKERLGLKVSGLWGGIWVIVILWMGWGYCEFFGWLQGYSCGIRVGDWFGLWVLGWEEVSIYFWVCWRVFGESCCLLIFGVFGWVFLEVVGGVYGGVWLRYLLEWFVVGWERCENGWGWFLLGVVVEVGLWLCDERKGGCEVYVQQQGWCDGDMEIFLLWVKLVNFR